jgi:thiamine-phosphate pyrophosphorylase
VYRTASHPGRAPLGVAAVAAVARLGLPVIAIGGVTPERIAELRAAGAYGVAAIRALWDAADAAGAAGAARAMLEVLER